MKKLLMLILVFAAVSCNRFDMDEILLLRNDVSLTWKGEEQFVYDPESCQMGFNASRKEFRVQTDNLSSWFVISCSDMPSSEGDEIEADISWTGTTDTRSMKALKFKVEKVSSDGMIWMWCRSAKIGVTFMKL
jgi:hypothetical protein